MTTGTDCVFCKIVLGESPCFKLLEDENTLAIMDIFPANDGHCLVLTKELYPSLFDVTEQAFAAVSRSVCRVARAVNQVLPPAGLNLVQANGPGARQTVNHFHVHVLPRKLGDQLLLNWAATPGDHATIAALAEKIRATLAGTLSSSH
jgi:histidine triad (HIT) family protein